MGLTKPRAAQIFNLDYKQSTRVVTVTNVALVGGAPSSVDGVSLIQGDRILVTGQSTGSQNGLYYVTTVGSGSNGTWARTSDGNENGEIEAGVIVMVTEGSEYADTQWKLITNDPIVIGTTALTFTQNYSANSISGGTSNVVVNSNANVTISSAGTANVTVFSNTGVFVSGVTSVTGNVTGGNILTAGLVSATGNVTGGNILTAGVTSVTGNITGGNIRTAGLVSATGNVTGGNLIAGTGASGNITGANVITANTVTAVANITAGNILTTGQISATSTITSAANVTGGNIITAGLITATGNINGGNILTVGVVSATGNVIGNFLIGNGSQITGIVVGAGASITNGTSNVTIQANSNVVTGVAGSTVGTFANTGLFVSGIVSATGNISGNFILGNGSQLSGLPATYGDSNVVTLLSNFGSNSISTTGNITAANLNSSNADLAEKYTADADYAPGTVVAFGGTQEVTLSTQSHATQVAGVISTSPAHTMNDGLVSKHIAMVALTGRVPCLVSGPVAKGDLLAASAIAGHAQRLDPAQYKPGCIIGKALTDYPSQQIGCIEVAVGRF